MNVFILWLIFCQEQSEQSTRHIPFSKRVKINAFYSQKQLQHAQKFIKSNTNKRNMCIY